jgi:hypothetical protein
MARFEVDGTDADSTVRRAWDTIANRFVVLEHGIRNERTRKIQSMPANPAIAPYERVRIGNRVQVIHPEPLEFAQPLDEFDVAQAIGSLLDGLAWLHANGVTHGAIDATALTAGPTGGRLSLAGALSKRAHATTEDDVYAASALAFTVLVGEAPGPDAQSDVRLAESASHPVVEAIRAGLDPDATRRPNAASLATMVRGEYLPPVHVTLPHPTLLTRLRDVLAVVVASSERLAGSFAQVLRPYTTRATAGIGAAFAMVLLIGGLALADQRGTGAVADASSSPAKSIARDVLAARVEPTSSIPALAMVALEDVIAKHDAVAQQNSSSVAVLSSATVAAQIPAPTTTAAPPPPIPKPVVVAAAPTTTAAPPSTSLTPPPVVTVTTTTAPTTTPATTTRVTTTRATTTTRVTTTRPTTTRSKGKDDDD